MKKIPYLFVLPILCKCSIVFLIAPFLSIKAQEKKTSPSIELIYLVNTTFLNPPIDTFRLITNNEYSLYSDYSTESNTKMLKEDTDNLFFSISVKAERFILTFNGSKKLFSKEYYFDKKYVWVQDTSTIKWTVSEETKQIASYLCKKATGNFKGREYIAWFTPSIPVSAGPWKLRGTPGLILEASDTGNEVSFSLLSIKQIKQPSIVESDYEKTKPISWEDYKKVWQVKFNNFNTFLNDSVQREGATVKVNTKVQLLEKTLLDEK